MSPEPCRRCGAAVNQSERYCRECGLDQRPNAPVLAKGEAMLALTRQREWLLKPRDLSRLMSDDAPKVQPATTATSSESDSESDRDEPPLDELLYWTSSARMLGDLQGLATAQAAHLRARCVAAGMSPAELDSRLEAALPQWQGTESVAPAGWYPDPAGGDGQRYWSGATWTGRVK